MRNQKIWPHWHPCLAKIGQSCPLEKGYGCPVCLGFYLSIFALLRHLPCPHGHVGVWAQGQNHHIASWAPNGVMMTWTSLTSLGAPFLSLELCKSTELSRVIPFPLLRKSLTWNKNQARLGVVMAVSGACLSCKQFPGDNLSNYPSKLELLCESSWVPLAYPVQLGVIKIQLSISGWAVQSHQGWDVYDPWHRHRESQYYRNSETNAGQIIEFYTQQDS